MHFLLAHVSCLLLMMISRCKTAMQEIDINGILKDIDEFDITCYGDKCRGYGYDSLSSSSCHCGIQCVRFETCCLNSFYVRSRKPKLKPACRSVYNGGETYYIIDECPSGSAWSSLCNEEWNRDDDVLKLVPVTSISSFITYKNYYCFRCHERTDDFLYWWLQINSNVFPRNKLWRFNLEELSLTYSKDIDTWMAFLDEDIGYFPVNISLQIPYKIVDLINNCKRDVISSCSDEWFDEEVTNKCHSYMSLKEVRRNNTSTLYKNIHCALCNFESLNEISCREFVWYPTSGVSPPTFSFSHLMDINRGDGELVGKVQKCSGDDVWDRFTKICRKVTCAVPGFKVKNNECVQE